jgi:hypothetical protein
MLNNNVQFFSVAFYHTKSLPPLLSLTPAALQVLFLGHRCEDGTRMCLECRRSQRKSPSQRIHARIVLQSH